jgi:hypothetical protein
MKPPWIISIYLKNEESEGKTDPVCGWVPVKVSREGEGGWIWWMYFVYMYENRTMKTYWNCSKKGEGRQERIMEGVNLTKIHCKHICKCHNETPVYN